MLLIPFMKTANLAHYSSYAESSLMLTANLMLNYLLKPVRHESFHRKYAEKRFLKVSIPNITRHLFYLCRVQVSVNDSYLRTYSVLIGDNAVK